jgi:hypothetical protein
MPGLADFEVFSHVSKLVSADKNANRNSGAFHTVNHFEH